MSLSLQLFTQSFKHHKELTYCNRPRQRSFESRTIGSLTWRNEEPFSNLILHWSGQSPPLDFQTDGRLAMISHRAMSVRSLTPSRSQTQLHTQAEFRLSARTTWDTRASMTRSKMTLGWTQVRLAMLTNIPAPIKKITTTDCNDTRCF